jgi:hypothetical protein
MNIELIVTDGEEYANQLDLQIDWDETGEPNTISIEEYNALNKILACEMSVYVLRRTAGGVGFQVDTMTEIRRSYINEYEKTFNKEYNYPNQGID